MNLSDATQYYTRHSARLSEASRQLGFAGIALIWIFGLGADPSATLPDELTLPALLIVASLSADFLHYLSSTIAWGSFRRLKERSGIDDETEFDAPSWINWPALFFFWTKVALLMAAYVALGVYLADRVLGPP